MKIFTSSIESLAYGCRPLKSAMSLSAKNNLTPVMKSWYENKHEGVPYENTDCGPMGLSCLHYYWGKVNLLGKLHYFPPSEMLEIMEMSGPQWLKIRWTLLQMFSMLGRCWIKHWLQNCCIQCTRPIWYVSGPFLSLCSKTKRFS